MSDALHNHTDLGLRPKGECPACDQVRVSVTGRPTKMVLS